MKKVLAILLTSIMVCSLAACSNHTVPAETTAAQAETAAQTTTAAPVTEAVTEAPATEAPAEKEIIEVDWYCSTGGYLSILQEQIDQWNEGDGKEKGVRINLISNIDHFSEDLNALMEAGTHFPLINGGDNAAWYQKGWIQNLREVDNPEIQALLDSYKDVSVSGITHYGDAVVTVPRTVEPVKFAVNLDLFEKNNLELPKTWDDVVHCAQVITENGGGKEFGFGWTTWGTAWRRLVFKESMSSTGKGWWDPNTATYDFSIFRPAIEAICTMYQNGWTMGADDLAIDPIRAQFAEGNVGMFPAPSYDYSVYTAQFPAKCNWTVIEPPTFEEGEAPYKGVYVIKAGVSIDAVAYAEADEATKKAIEEAWLFLDGDELYRTLYQRGAIISPKASVFEGAEIDPSVGPQWALFSDLSNYAPVPVYPDGVLPLEGDKFPTVFASVMHGDIALDDAFEDLNTRYNAAYQELKADDDIDMSVYEYEYKLDR
ncbi:MAG: ABC transporter substrate-binding protein [Lachnospiraceae bacterium]|nr:ABC transporter substrate-binding protein [Lachnospiraceae bacterium]